MGYHVVSINRTFFLPSNKTHRKVVPYSLILYSSSPYSLLLASFHNRLKYLFGPHFRSVCCGWSSF